jgi:CRISPR-associated endonuclease/helicase Cas3
MSMEHRGYWLRAALGLRKNETPFPWQDRLLKEMIDRNLPSALDIPTGIGKTAVIAIWTIALAAGAKIPRRLIYVVDRRAVVDQATTEAERIRAVIEADAGLKKALGLTRPLPISTLRGQYVDNQEWLEDPSSPAIVVGTVDMIGSRLLFEGYRCSRKMRPYHAALLGADALIVLDEAHLVPAFEAMARGVVNEETLKAHTVSRDVIPVSRVMSLSATGRGASSTFQLDDVDQEHAVVKRRLDAKKVVRLAEPVEGDALAETLATKAWELADFGKHASRVLVFVDSRRTAQEVKEAIEKRAKADGEASKIAVETELFVGGRRVAEREAAAKRLNDLGIIAGSKTKPEKPVFVVATSAGEVGVDLDADHAVLDLVEWERVVQRLGRVNRRGEREADVWIVPTVPDEKLAKLLEKDARVRKETTASDDEGDDAEDDEADESEGKEPKRLKPEERERVAQHWRREATARALRNLPVAGGAYLASPRALVAIKLEHGTLVEDASTPAPLHPALTRSVVESWSMTSLEEHTGRPNVRPWLRGWIEEEVQTAIVWRRWLPKPADARAFFEAAPVEMAETLEMESTFVLDWLGKRVKKLMKAHEDASRALKHAELASADAEETRERPSLASKDLVMFVLDNEPRGWTLEQLDSLDKRGRDDLFRDLSGETMVVDVRLGGLDDDGLLDAKKDSATDVSETAQLPFRVLEADDPANLSEHESWRVEAVFDSRTNDDGEPISWLVIETNKTQPSTTADGRSTGNEQGLAEHQALAERHARRIGERVGLRSEHVDLLALAAVRHDERKKAEHWQRAFRAPKETRPRAKTTSRPLQSILAG